MSWKNVEALPRDLEGHFVLKGIMHPDDAIRAHSLGVDGIMVSNHGARQLDIAPSPLEVLPSIRDAVGDKMTLMLDGGVRRGMDAIVALCSGARFVFVGRPTLYGVAAGGIPGAAKALGIFRREVDITLAQIGAAKIADLGPQFLMWKDEEDFAVTGGERHPAWPAAPVLLVEDVLAHFDLMLRFALRRHGRSWRTATVDQMAAAGPPMRAIDAVGRPVSRGCVHMSPSPRRRQLPSRAEAESGLI
jgi:hypothetical protein